MEVPEFSKKTGGSYGRGYPENPVTETLSGPVFVMSAPMQDNACMVKSISLEESRFLMLDVPADNAAHMSMRWEILLDPGIVAV
jgi:hypothetical protein